MIIVEKRIWALLAVQIIMFITFVQNTFISGEKPLPSQTKVPFWVLMNDISTEITSNRLLRSSLSER